MHPTLFLKYGCDIVVSGPLLVGYNFLGTCKEVTWVFILRGRLVFGSIGMGTDAARPGQNLRVALY